METKKLIRPVLLGLAGTSPFFGTIGQEPIKDIKGAKEFSTLKELESSLRTGDVLLENAPKRHFSVFSKKMEFPSRKFFNALFTGSPWHHTEAVGKNKKLSFRGVNIEYKTPHRNLRQLKGSDFLLLRPKNKLTVEQEKKFNKELQLEAKKPWGAKDNYLAQKAIASGHAHLVSDRPIKALIKDWFVPKFGKKSKNLKTEGAMCSGTVPSIRTRIGKDTKSIVKGKHPIDLFPVDFLRSDDYKIVGVFHSKTEVKPSPTKYELAHVLSRGLTGSGIALGLSKLIK